MILVLSATNRVGSKTKIVADEAFDYLSKHYEGEVRFLSLEDVPASAFGLGMYKPENMPNDLMRIQDELLIPADKWLIIAPEYNGSYPGIFKMFIDAISVRRYKETFAGRKAGLIGVSSGRAGNLIGMSHMVAFLSYLKLTMFPVNLPLSSIETLVEDGKLKENALSVLHSHLNTYLAWHNS